MVINSENFTSIELARQAAIRAAEAQDLKYGFECLRYCCETGQGFDYVEGLYPDHFGDYVWLHAGIEIK